MRVLYIDCDTLRPDHLGCYGYHRATSPSVDAIAAEGVVFDRVHVSDVPCLPSRTALFSGQLGFRTGVVAHAGKYARGRYPGDGHSTDPERQPLAMVLSRAGMHTATFSTFHQRHLSWRYCAGWDEIRRFTQTIGDEIATDLEGPATEWLRHHGRRDDWFLHLHFWDPHVPYNTPLDYGNPFDADPPPDFPSEQHIVDGLSSFGPSSAADVANDYFRPHPRMPHEFRGRADFRTLIDGYDVGIRFFDDTLGRLMNLLADLGVLDDTAVLLSSDHGENQGELGLYAAHSSADAITTRVPLVIRWPGAAAGTRVDAPLYQLDLAPTLCEMLGVDAPAKWDGRSFAPAVHGQPVEGRQQLFFGQGAGIVQRAVIENGYLYLRTLHPGLNQMPDELLFNLTDDPHEQIDLMSTEPARAASMRTALLEWTEAMTDETGDDPIGAVAAEGGYYARLFKENYVQRLRLTGRAAAADEIEKRFVAPILDPYDADYF